MLEVIIWDVQHGSAIYIKTPNGTHIVQDLGTVSLWSNKPSFSPLLHLKNKYGVSQLWTLDNENKLGCQSRIRKSAGHWGKKSTFQR